MASTKTFAASIVLRGEDYTVTGTYYGGSRDYVSDGARYPGDSAEVELLTLERDEADPEGDALTLDDLTESETYACMDAIAEAASEPADWPEDDDRCDAREDR